MARGLKFRIKVGEGLYHPCSENKGADQLRSYCAAALRLCFRICKNPVFSWRGSNKFWSRKNSTEILNKLKAKGFQAFIISTYDFSKLYTTLAHDLIKSLLVDLIENTFRRDLVCNEERAFFASEEHNNITYGHVKK